VARSQLSHEIDDAFVDFRLKKTSFPPGRPANTTNRLSLEKATGGVKYVDRRFDEVRKFLCAELNLPFVAHQVSRNPLV
jgi:hypothetical protein